MKKTGAMISPYDPRDYTVAAKAVTLPPIFTAEDVEIYDQGRIGNCVMQALSSAPHAFYGKRMGVTFGYGRWRTHKEAGMYPSEAANGFVKEGIPPKGVDSALYEVPEAIDYAKSQSAKMLNAAKPYIGWTWARPATVEEIKTVIYQSLTAKGTRCIVSLPYHAIDNSGVWRIYTDKAPNGHHEMAIIGWDDSKQMFKVRNSWGTGGGLFGYKGGYVWVRYSDIFANGDVIALFPPATVPEDETITKPRRTLRLKDKPRMQGEDVKELQTRLNSHGVKCDIDGVFGPDTHSAVLAFQRGCNLVPDGICGAKTWAALDKEPVQPEPGPEPNDLAKGLVKWAYSKLHHLYVWGGNGQTEISEGWIRRMDTSDSNAQRSISFWKKLKAEGMSEIEAFDCSGLISRYLQNIGITDTKQNCDMLWRRCKAIRKSELAAGDLCFREKNGDFHHVGVYVGNGLVIEAKGRDDGVIIRGIDSAADYWTDYGRLVW